jgi:SnoaL-like protein
MARGQTPQEVLEHHAGALGAGDLDGVLHGKDGVRQGFTKLLADVPNAAWKLNTVIFEGDILFLEWAATAAATKVEDGVDTFLFGDGQIRVQTVRYTVQPTS